MTLEKLLKDNSGLLSRMKERDGNQKLNEICEKIQQEIAEELTTMTELVPFSIKVKVANIE